MELAIVFWILGIVFVIGFPPIALHAYEEGRIRRGKPLPDEGVSLGHVIVVPVALGLVVAMFMLLAAALLSDWIEPSGRYLLLTTLLSIGMYLIALASLLNARRDEPASGRQSDAYDAEPLASGGIAGDRPATRALGEPADGDIEQVTGVPTLAKGRRRR